MGKENFVGRLLLKRFFREILGKLLDDGKDTRAFLQFKKQKDQDLNFPRILLFHGENGLGKTTALNQCIELARDFCSDSKKSLSIINIDWDDWYCGKWSLPSNNLELMSALYQIFTNKNTGISGYFSRFEELHGKVQKISNRVNELIRNEWRRESTDITSLEMPEQDQLKIWLQKKIPKQDLDILDKADTKLAEILINGLSEACNEAPVIISIDNYEYLQADVEKWFRTAFLNRLSELRLITIISGSTYLCRNFRNIFSEESLFIINFADITLSKLDILQLAAKKHISISESEAEKIEQISAGIPLVVQDIFSYVTKDIPLSDLLPFNNESESINTEQLIAEIGARFLKYCTDNATRERVFHLVMLKQFNPALVAQLWQVSVSDVNNIMNGLSEQFSFINDKRVHSLVKSSLTTFLNQELSSKSDPELISFFNNFTAICSQYFSDQMVQLEKSILSSELRYTDERYCNALIGYYCSILWSNPESAFNSLPGTYVELIHFNVNFIAQLFWHVSEFRAVLQQNCIDILDTLYSGITLADKSFLSDRTPVQPFESSVMSFLDDRIEQMTDFQQALVFHKKGELCIRQNEISEAKSFFDNSLSLMDPTATEREILYEDYILLGNEFASVGDYEQVIAVIKSAVSINSANHLPWFDLGMAYLKISDYQNAVEALSKSVSINPDYQDTWYYLGISYAAVENHSQAVISFNNAVEKGPENSEIYYNMGLSLEKIEKNSDAVNTYQKVVTLDPKNVDAWYRIGLLNSILGQSNEAIDALGNAIKIKPDLTGAHRSLGNEYSKIGKFKNAAESFEKAAELNQDDCVLWNQVASAWFSADQNQKAIDAAEKSISLKSDSSEPWLVIGHAYTALGNFTEANTAYTKASELSPDDAAVWVNLGNNYYAQSMYEEAIESFKKAVAIDPNKEGTWFNLGLAYRVKEQYTEALDAFENAIKQEPSNPECWFQKGRIHMTLNQFEEAADSFTKTVDLSPTSHDAWYKRGLAYAKCSNHAEAIKSFAKAAELWSTDPDIWFNMALSYAAIDNFKDAVKSYQEASTLASSRQEIWYNLGHSLQMLGQFQEAIDAYSKAIDILPDHFLSNYNKGVCLYYLGNYNEAQGILSTAVSLQPENTDSLLFLALSCHAMEKYSEAINYYGKITEIKPDSSEAWFNMALAYHALPDYDKAIEVYAETVKRWPENGTAWYNMGLVYHTRNELDDAIKSYREATKVSPEHPEMWYSLATAYHSQEHYGDAIQAYRKVTKLSPDHIDAHFNLGLSYSMWGHHTDAIESFSKVVKLKPDHLLAWGNLCISYYSVGQHDQSIESGLKALELKADEAWVLSYLVLSSVLTGKIAKAHELTEKLILVNSSGEEISRTLYYLNQEIVKNPSLQGAQEIIQKLEGAQMDTISVSIPVS